ncbi:MAG: guanylate kinase [Coxiellaceae bacterium]|nr:guanylate kinase [Coxiellaceae bacterium]
MVKSKGTLYIIAAASGTGKTSLSQALSQSVESIKISVSHTTRPIRSNEQDGKHYFFTTPEKFKLLIHQEAFLEYAQLFNYYYGTSIQFVEEQLNAGFDIILNIDWQGARQVKSKIKCTSIFLLPPSVAELRIRLEKRNREGADIIKQRLASARFEISHYKEFDYVIINDKFENALADLRAIVHSKKLLLYHQIIKHNRLLKELLR